MKSGRTKLLAVFMLIMLAIPTLVILNTDDEGTDASTITHGSQSNPLTSLRITSSQLYNDYYGDDHIFYIRAGSPIDISTDYSDGDLEQYHLKTNPYNIGHGLTYSSTDYTLTGSLSGTGSFTMLWEYVVYGSPESTDEWTINIVGGSSSYTYTLSYNANGGSGAPSSQTYTGTSTSHSFIVPSTTPTRSGYNFLGWSFNSGASSASYVSGNSVTLYSSEPSRTLYAVWQQQQTTYNYSLSYNGNGGSGVPSTQTSGSTTSTSYTFTVPSTTPSRSGYNFLGWSFSSTATSASYVSGSSVTLYNSNPSRTLYAVWQQQTSYNYSLSYNANGGLYAPNQQTATSTNTSYTFTIPWTIPLRPNYDFTGWAFSSSASSADYGPGDRITLTSGQQSRTLYAVWGTRPDTITHGSLNSPLSSLTITSNQLQDYLSDNHVFYIKAGSSISISGYWGDVYEDYYLDNRTSNPGHGLSYSSSNYILSGTLSGQGEFYLSYIHQIDSAYDYTDTWTIIVVYEFTLTYNANGGSGGPGAVTVYSTDLSYIFYITTNDPTRTGFQFIGWADSSTATSPDYVHGNSITLTSSSPTKTIYAVYSELNYYSLTYNTQGGTPQPTPFSRVTIDDSVTLNITPTLPQKSGYNFLGWALNQNATVPDYVYPAQITLTKNNPVIILYAVWETVYTYSITFNGNGGVNLPSLNPVSTTATSYTFTIPTNPVPTRSGYVFLGYGETAVQTTDLIAPGDQYTIDSTDPPLGRVLYAIWQTVLTYKLNYNINGGEGNVPMSQSHTGIETSWQFDIPQTPVPSRVGYNFKGYSENPNASEGDYQPGGTFTINSSDPPLERTLYAIWQLPDITVSIMVIPPGYGTVDISTFQVPNGTRVSVTDDTPRKLVIGQYTVTPTPANSTTQYTYSFNSWSQTYGTLTENTIIYAKFTRMPISINVAYNAHATTTVTVGGVSETIGVNGFSATYNQATAVDLSTVAATGYVVNGYNYYYNYDPDTIYFIDAPTWYVRLGSIYYSDITIWANVSIDISIYHTFWNNGYENQKLSLMYSIDRDAPQVLNKSLFYLDRDTGQKDLENKEVFVQTADYIEIDTQGNYRQNVISVTSFINGVETHILTDRNMGSWLVFYITLDLSTGSVYFTGCTWNNDVDFTSYTEIATEYLCSIPTDRNSAVYTVLHIPTDYSSRIQMMNTWTFLNTYDVVMMNPTMNINDYWPNIDTPIIAIRSVALYGESMYITGMTMNSVPQYQFAVENGSITIPYYHDVESDRNIYSAEGPLYKTVMLTNMQIVYYDNYVKVEFLNEHNIMQQNVFSFYITGLATNYGKIIGFGGLWYFNALLLESKIVQVQEYEFDPWKGITVDNNVVILGFLAALVLGAIGGRFIFGLRSFDIIIIIVAGIIGITILGGL